MLEIKDLHVSIDGKEILKGVNLSVKKGKVHVLMGPNGSGKSTLAHVLMGHPRYEVTKGNILFNGEDITSLSPRDRAQKGLFLSFQYPLSISGVTIRHFLREAEMAVRGKKTSLLEFQKSLEEKASLLGLPVEFLDRYVNEGFSGGEKKKNEMLQLLILNPLCVVLDETDSGLDIDALRIVAESINQYKDDEKCVLLITHYQRILEHIQADIVSVMQDGMIVAEGDRELVHTLEEKGYRGIDANAHATTTH